MKKATFIDPKDLQQLEFDTDGNIIIPEGFEIYIKEDPQQVRLNRIAELEAELSEMTEPSDEELIELGKSFHDYYILKMNIEQYKNEYR